MGLSQAIYRPAEELIPGGLLTVSDDLMVQIEADVSQGTATGHTVFIVTIVTICRRT